MARIRQVKPSFWYDEDLGRIPRDARLLAIGLLNLADSAGRLDDKPGEIKARLFPHDKLTLKQIDAWLDALADIRFVFRYEVDGAKYLEIRNFTKHQRPHPHEAPSTIPPPPPERKTGRKLSYGDQPLLTGGENGENLSENHEVVTCHDISRQNRKIGAGSGFLDLGSLVRTEASAPTGAPDAPADHNKAVQTFLAAFCDLWKTTHHGARYQVKPAKHVPLVKALLKAHGHDRLLQLAHGLQLVDDDWIAKTDRGLEILSSQINKLELWCAEEEARYAQR